MLNPFSCSLSLYFCLTCRLSMSTRWMDISTRKSLKYVAYLTFTWHGLKQDGTTSQAFTSKVYTTLNVMILQGCDMKGIMTICCYVKERKESYLSRISEFNFSVRTNHYAKLAFKYIPTQSSIKKIANLFLLLLSYGMFMFISYPL